MTSTPSKGPQSKSVTSEVRLKELLDKLKLPSLDIRQEKGELPTFLKESGKRVDFIVFIRGKGVIAIDAKERNNSDKTFDILTEDAQALRDFEKKTGIHTWIAFMYAPAGTWHFIDTYSLLENNRGLVRPEKNSLVVEKQACSPPRTIENMNAYFFRNYLNQFSEFVFTRNPKLAAQKPKSIAGSK